MVSFCRAGDKPTVYYRFATGPWQTIKIGAAPLDIQIDSSGGNDNSAPSPNSPDEQPPSIPCPPEGRICHLTATGFFYFSEGQPGQRQTFAAEGWEITEIAVEHDEEMGWKWTVTATSNYSFARGITRPSPPNYYADSGVDFSGWQVSDDCFPNGGDPQTCSDSSSGSSRGSSQPPDNQDKLARIKIFYQGHLLWQKSGKPSAEYKVTCGEDCPEGFIKCFKDSGYYCLPCNELRNSLIQIQSILRKNA